MASGSRPRFELLSAAEIERIHAAALDVLESAGVFVESAEALELFAAAGCRIETAQRIAHLPPERRGGGPARGSRPRGRTRPRA